MLTVLLAFFTTTSHAFDVQPSRYLPSASPIESGRGEVEVGGFAGLGIAGTVAVNAAVADRFVIGANINGFYVPVPFSGLAMHTYPAFVSARYDLTESDGLNVAPFALIGASYTPYFYDAIHPSTGQPREVLAHTDGFTMMGVAIEGGSDKLRFDLSAPLAGLTWQPELNNQLRFVHAYLLSELGLTWRIEDGHSVRLGTLLAILPNVAYRHDWANMFVEVHGGFVTPLPGVGVSGGIRW